MPNRPVFLAAVVAVACSACGGTTTTPPTITPPPEVTFSTEMVETTDTVLARTKDSSEFLRNTDTEITGSADFTGAFLADLNVNSVGDQSLAGEVMMRMNFDEDTVTGSLTNFGIADANGVATEGVLGTIPLTGSVGEVQGDDKPSNVPGSGSAGGQTAQNILRVSGRGVLSGTFGEDTFRDIPIDLDMLGHARTELDGRRNWFSGVIAGAGTSIYNLDFNGRFYVRRNGRDLVRGPQLP